MTEPQHCTVITKLLVVCTYVGMNFSIKKNTHADRTKQNTSSRLSRGHFVTFVEKNLKKLPMCKFASTLLFLLRRSRNN